MQIFAASHLLPMTGPAIAGGAIAVDNGQIIAAGTRNDLTALFAAPVTDYPGCVIMPGLVNAHTHLGLTHFPAWKIRKGLDYMPRTYVDWVIQVIKISRGLSADEKIQSLREGIAKSLEAGTTTIGEIVTDFSLLGIYANSPLRGRLLLEAIGLDHLRNQAFLATLRTTLSRFPCGNLLPGISPHTPHTVSDDLLVNLAAEADTMQVPLAIHLAESPDELPFAHDSTGAIATQLYPFVGWEQYLAAPRRTTPTAHLGALNVLSPLTLAIHCVQITPADAEILRQHNVGIVLCPRSNERLNVGRAPVALFKRMGIRLALGTDSLASNDSLSLWDEMRTLMEYFPDVFTADDVIALATRAGADLLGLETQTGSLKAGKHADFLVVQPTAQPKAPENVAASLITGNRIIATAIGGVFC